MGDIRLGIVTLLNASIAPNTMLSYKTALRAFERFQIEFNLEKSWPVECKQVILFISYCYEKGLSSNTISTYIAGINYVHKLHGWEDLRSNFIITKMLEGCRRLRFHKDIRLPITLEILSNICQVLPQVCYSHYEATLFKAAFLLAFYGMFRVSELVAPSSLLVQRTLSFQDVILNTNLEFIYVTLRISKCNQSGHPVKLKIPREKNVDLCPVSALKDFLTIRPNIQGPFFCHVDGKPVTRSQFSCVLIKSLGRVRPECSNIKAHSFRIGRATHLFQLGLSGKQIQALGRWRSEAYKKYIRLPS